ncbi:MAG TPA: hypothetical protein VK533_07320, partial [Sphingomonas sp.]|uniref:hypothetical protein n=1 Tax=Sphingomonas sp. TaxID=28214 RepID=UPI002BF52168
MHTRSARLLLRAQRLAGVLILASLAGTAPCATPTISTQTFDSALEIRAYRESVKILNVLVAARLPARPAARPDPLLDRLFGVYFASRGVYEAATPFLARAALTAEPGARPHLRLLLAVAQEVRADFDGAEKSYEAVLQDKELSAADRQTAALGAARIKMLGADPQQAAAVLQGLTPNGGRPADIWRIELAAARIHAISGNNDRADAALARAWAATPLAGSDGYAILRVSNDLAVKAGRVGDRDHLAALLALNPSNKFNAGNDPLYDNAPVCGRDGVTAADAVILETIQHPTEAEPRVEVVWASRPGMAKPFLAAGLRATPPQTGPQMFSWVGRPTLYTMRCRQSVSANYTVADTSMAEQWNWQSSQGVYPVLPLGDEDDTSTIATALSARETRYGPESVFLVPLLEQTLTIAARDMSTPEGRARAADLATRLQTIFQKAKAPPTIQAMVDLRAVMLRASAQRIAMADAIAQAKTIFETSAQNPDISPDEVFQLVSVAANEQSLPREFRSNLLGVALGVLERRVGRADPRAQALALRLAELDQESGSLQDADAVIAKYALPADTCALARPPARLASSGILADDYPVELINAELAGADTIEFEVGIGGAAQNARVVVASPPFAFDDITLSRSSTLRYEVTHNASDHYACRAQKQTVRWQLPY